MEYRKPLRPEVKRQRCEQQVLVALRRLSPLTAHRYSIRELASRFITEALELADRESSTAYNNADTLRRLSHFEPSAIEARIRRSLEKR